MADLVGRPEVGEVERAGGGRRHRVEDGEPADPVVAVVDVAAAEVQRGRVGAHDGVGLEPAHDLDQPAPQVEVVLGLAVGVAEQLERGEPEHRGGLGHLPGAGGGEGVRIGVRGRRSLLAPVDDDQVGHRALVDPAGQGAAARDLGIVGVGVDGEHGPGHGGVGPHEREGSGRPPGQPVTSPPCTLTPSTSCGWPSGSPPTPPRRRSATEPAGWAWWRPSPPPPTWSPRSTGPPRPSSSPRSGPPDPTTASSARRAPTSPGTSGVRWLIDPIDGTTNFLYGLPGWGVSIAAADDDGPGRRRGRHPQPRRAVQRGPRPRRPSRRRAAALQRQGRPGDGPGRHRLLLPAGATGRAGHGAHGPPPPRAGHPALRLRGRGPLLRRLRPARRLLRGRARPLGPGRRRDHRPRGRRHRHRPRGRPGAGRLGPRLLARAARAVPRRCSARWGRRTDHRRPVYPGTGPDGARWGGGNADPDRRGRRAHPHRREDGPRGRGLDRRGGRQRRGRPRRVPPPAGRRRADRHHAAGHRRLRGVPVDPPQQRRARSSWSRPAPTPTTWWPASRPAPTTT